MKASANAASTFARSLLNAAIANGVRHVVVSPGARSQALALEAAALEAEGRLRLHVRIDERGAAFMALGVARETGFPAAVITTSGSAVANLLPAVVEAHHAGIPMVLLTADRPAQLRGTRANQTTRQDLMLQPFVLEVIDVEPPTIDTAVKRADELMRYAVGLASGVDGTPGAGMGGPVQLNLQLVPPLSGPIDPVPNAVAAPILAPATAAAVPVVANEKRTIVVAGSGAGDEAEAFARAIDAPLFAEIVSNAHFGPQLVVAYRQLLRVPEFADTIERAVVFGTPALSREIAVLARPEVELIVVDSPGADRFWPVDRPQQSLSRAVASVRGDGSATAEQREWASVWVAASRKLLADAAADREVASTRSGVAYGGHVEDFAAQRNHVSAELAAIRAPLNRERLVEAVWNASWPHDRLVFGASRLVRVADSMLSGKKVRVHANRGQSGIDGTIATGLGVAAALDGGMTRVLLGDLAALHDVSSLQRTPGEPAPALQVIVGNDRGGTIFTGLEVAKSAEPAAFERVQLTPHTVSFEALVTAYDWEYRLADNVGALDQALTEPSARPVLIEVPLER